MQVVSECPCLPKLIIFHQYQARPYIIAKKIRERGIERKAFIAVWIRKYGDHQTIFTWLSYFGSSWAKSKVLDISFKIKIFVVIVYYIPFLHHIANKIHKTKIFSNFFGLWIFVRWVGWWGGVQSDSSVKHNYSYGWCCGRVDDMTNTILMSS